MSPTSTKTTCPRLIRGCLAVFLACAGVEGFAQTQRLETIGGTITHTTGAVVPARKSRR